MQSRQNYITREDLTINKEFIINKYITVKLEGNETVIYVAGKPFEQCRILLLNIPIDDVEQFDEIESIDEVADRLNWDIDDGQEGIEYDIPPETEFFGHCSNLQAWYEHQYDTNLLHSSLSFPLLRKLADVGDKIAQKVFREEIAKRFHSRNPTVMNYLLNEGYLDYLDVEERFDYLLEGFEYFEEDYYYEYQIYTYSHLIETMKSSEFKTEKFHILLNLIDRLPYTEDDHTVFTKLIDSIKDTELISTERILIGKKFSKFIKGLSHVPIEFQYDAYSQLINAIKGTELMADKFKILLNKLEILPRQREIYSGFTRLIGAIKGTEMINTNHSLIEKKFSELLKRIDNLPEDDRNSAFLKLVHAIKGTELLVENFSELLRKLMQLPDNTRRSTYSKFYDIIKKTALETETFQILSNKLNNLTYEIGKQKNQKTKKEKL